MRAYVCACVRAEAFSDRLAVDFLFVLLQNILLAILCIGKMSQSDKMPVFLFYFVMFRFIVSCVSISGKPTSLYFNCLFRLNFTERPTIIAYRDRRRRNNEHGRLRAIHRSVADKCFVSVECISLSETAYITRLAGAQCPYPP